MPTLCCCDPLPVSLLIWSPRLLVVWLQFLSSRCMHSTSIGREFLLRCREQAFASPPWGFGCVAEWAQYQQAAPGRFCSAPTHTQLLVLSCGRVGGNTCFCSLQLFCTNRIYVTCMTVRATICTHTCFTPLWRHTPSVSCLNGWRRHRPCGLAHGWVSHTPAHSTFHVSTHTQTHTHTTGRQHCPGAFGSVAGTGAHALFAVAVLCLLPVRLAGGVMQARSSSPWGLRWSRIINPSPPRPSSCPRVKAETSLLCGQLC